MTIAGNSVGRRTVLRGGLAGAAVLAAPAIVRAQEATRLTFSFAPDETGSLDSLIERFNTEHDGAIEVSLREMPARSDDYFRLLMSDFSVGSGEIDVIGGDNIWTATFAANGYVRELSRLAAGEYGRGDFLAAPVRTVRWTNRVWAVPWFTAAGMLYYRRDLLEAVGLSAPATWGALTSASEALAEAGSPSAFVFQGAAYEGGVTNALEYIWSAGGRLMTTNVATHGGLVPLTTDPNVVTADSADVAEGLSIAGELVASGVAPVEVAEFDEAAALERFAAGEAAFMRHWPFAYGLMRERELPFDLDAVGVAPIPAVREGGPSYSTLGGWNLMISAFSNVPQAAWEFVRFAASEAQQKARALEGSYLPTRAALYDDEDVRSAVPVIDLGEEALANARTRPASPYYMELSPRIAQTFNRVLRQELSGEEAAATLQRDLSVLVSRRGGAL